MLPVLEEIYSFCHIYYNEFSYKMFPRKTDKQKMKLLCMVLYNEINYWRYKGKRLRYFELDDTGKILSILLYSINIWNTDKNSMEIALHKHQDRVIKINSDLYQYWKRQCKLALSDYQFCAYPGCKKVLDLHTDHVFSKFDYPDLEWNVDNSQMLCSTHNLNKTNNSIDYRTPEMIAAQQKYIKESLNGNNKITELPYKIEIEYKVK